MASIFKKKTRFAAAAAIAACMAAGSASAMTLTFDGWEEGYKSVNVTAPVHNGAAGGFKMKDISTADSFIVFCLDLLAVISNNKNYTYTETATPFGNSVDLVANGGIDRIQKIFDSGYATAFTTSTASAGFQVALWNAVYDTDWSVSDNAGTFYQSSSNGGVRAAANGFLATAQNYMGPKAWDLTYLESTSVQRSQNLVTANATTFSSPPPSPVPLPAAGWMLIAAVGGLFFGRRRKAA